MKALAAILFLTLGVSSLAWSKPENAQVKISIEYKGVDAKWFSEISRATDAKDGSVKLPSFTSKIGKNAKLQIIQTYPSNPAAPDSAVVSCGAIVDLTPKLDDHGIRLSGTSVLRFPTDKSGEKTATRFRAQENLIDMKFDQGSTKTVELEDGGQMIITAMLVDEAGKPIR